MGKVRRIPRLRGKYRFLSNFYLCSVSYEGITYPSVEHAYQAAKFDSCELRNRILNTTNPGSVRLMVNSLGPPRHDWYSIRLDVMYQLVREKFNDPDLEKLLLSTENCEIINGDECGDTYWGVYRCNGENNLGKVLMAVRNDIINSRIGDNSVVSEFDKSE